MCMFREVKRCAVGVYTLLPLHDINESQDDCLCVILPLPRRSAISPTSPRSNSRHQARLISLFLHLRIPLSLRLCSVALHARSVPAHVIATDREEDSVDSHPGEQDAKVAADVGLLEVEEG